MTTGRPLSLKLQEDRQTWMPGLMNIELSLLEGIESTCSKIETLSKMYQGDVEEKLIIGRHTTQEQTN